MAGFDFTIYTRFNSGNEGAYSGSTVVDAPTGGNNPQDVDKIVDETNSGGLTAGTTGEDLQIVEGLSKSFVDLGAQSISTTITEPITTVGETTITVASTDNIVVGTVLLIGTEKLLVSEIASLVLTVTRGHNGTTSATHLDNAAVAAVPTNSNGGGFGLQASLTSGQTTVTSFKVVITFYKLNGVTTTAIKTYTLTEASSCVARDAIQLSADFGAPTSGDTISHIDVTPDPDGAIVAIQGVLNWNS